MQDALKAIANYPLGDILTYEDLQGIISEMQGIAAAALAKEGWRPNENAFTCPGCGRDTNVIYNRSSCPSCAGLD